MRTFNIPKIESKKVDLESTSSELFVSRVLGPSKRVHFNTNTGIVLPEKKIFWQKGYLEQFPLEKQEVIIAEAKEESFRPTSTVSNFVMALHSAFDKHIPFTLSPEVIMMVTSQEVALYVKEHSTETDIACWFTKTPNEKQQINVEINHFIYENENPWLEGIIQFRDKLIETVPSNIIGNLLPKFSNTSLEIETAHLVSFMDAASKYYDYSMSTCCGIPSFKIEGSAEDWDKIMKSAAKLKELLPGLNVYFANLLPVLKEIRDVADGNKVDYDYWSSIYKENGGSGGPYSNGWFNNFYAYSHYKDYSTMKPVARLKDSRDYTNTHFGPKLNNFPSNLSNVPFIWNYYEKEIPMSFVAGISSVEMNDGFLTPKLGVMVLEN